MNMPMSKILRVESFSGAAGMRSANTRSPLTSWGAVGAGVVYSKTGGVESPSVAGVAEEIITVTSYTPATLINTAEMCRRSNS